MTAILKVDTIQDTAGNNIINESSDTITIGASGDTTNIIGTLQNNGSAVASTNGITMADQWRLTANVTLTDPEAFVTSNWERNDNSGYGGIGTGMTESSGTFSFPKTGLYKVEFIVRVINGSSDTISGIIHVTINNSSYDPVALCSSGASTGTFGHSMIASALVNVTDISNVKVRFESSSIGTSSSFEGDTDRNQTCFTFIRLGDSQ